MAGDDDKVRVPSFMAVKHGHLTDSTYVTCTVRQRQLRQYRHVSRYLEANHPHRVVSLRDDPA